MPRTTTTAALGCAVLLTAAATACGPGPADAAPQPSASAPAQAPLTGDPAAVLRAAYEETERADSKTALITRRIGAREITAKLTFENDSSCYGEVKVNHHGTGEILVNDSKVSLRGDTDFLQDQFRDLPAKSPDTEDGWIDLKPGDPSVAHLLTLCKDGSPARTFPADRTGLHRGRDTYLNARPVAVFLSKAPDGTDITDHVHLDGKPYLLAHWEAGPNPTSVEYKNLTRAG
ncbi:hypothetical protein WDV06_35280 [Streptomyces racemochromogenes]|uniref:Lipoprotein n=1 Tax=Streptomyces racemochromogenes TaxID=67353 RepID=A0ABW7PPI2_9ACTN